MEGTMVRINEKTYIQSGKAAKISRWVEEAHHLVIRVPTESYPEDTAECKGTASEKERSCWPPLRPPSSRHLVSENE